MSAAYMIMMTYAVNYDNKREKTATKKGSEEQ